MMSSDQPYLFLCAISLANYYATTLALWFGHWFAHLKRSPLAPFHVLGHHAFYPDSRHLMSARFIYGQRRQSSIYSLLPWLMVQSAIQLALLSWPSYFISLTGEIALVIVFNQIHTEFHLHDSRWNGFRWFQKARRRHALHHDDDVNYMVGDHFWDRLFGTFADYGSDGRTRIHAIRTVAATLASGLARSASSQLHSGHDESANEFTVMAKIRYPAVLLISLVVGACVSYAPIADRTEDADPASAYMYGRFHIATSETATAGLKIVNLRTGTDYVIEFKEKDHVIAIKLEPGAYRITSVVGLGGFAKAKIMEKPLEETEGSAIITRPLLISKNEALYIGDYVAKFTFKRGIVVDDLIWHWNVSDRYVETTRVFLANHKGFTHVPKRSIFFAAQELGSPL